MKILFSKIPFILFICLLLVGCIKNDIPYPNIEANILVFEIEGQIGKTKIETEKRMIEILLPDTMDFSNLTLNDIQLSENTTISPNLSIGDKIDLRDTLVCTTKMFQSSDWKVFANEEIIRYVEVENQIREARINVDARKVTVYVPEGYPLDNIKITAFKLGPRNATVSPSHTLITNFSTPQEFEVSYNNGLTVEKWTVEVNVASVGSGSLGIDNINAWARFAYVDGFYTEDFEDITFEGKKITESAWSVLTHENLVTASGVFSAKVTGLEPETEYIIRPVATGAEGMEFDFTTETVLQIPNSNFEHWHKAGVVWYPNIDLSVSTYWWDSGNTGATTIGSTNPTMPESTIVISGNAAKLSSTFIGVLIFGKFAAGSIYLGKYIRTIGTSGAEIEMGKPFTSRPSALKGYYRYNSGSINYADSKYSSLKNKPDSCHIYALLTDREEPYNINTSEEKFIDFDGNDIIAFAELIDGSGTNEEYKEFTLNFEYRDLQRKPKQIVLVASSSKYGDYFTGSTNSVLYIDEFELFY